MKAPPPPKPTTLTLHAKRSGDKAHVTLTINHQGKVTNESYDFLMYDNGYTQLLPGASTINQDLMAALAHIMVPQPTNQTAQPADIVTSGRDFVYPLKTP